MTMNKWLAAAMLCLTAVGAPAQIAYRCGNTYSQEPCPQARVVDVGDARTDAQRAEGLRVAALDRQMADTMGRERLARDAAAKGGNSKAAKSTKAKRPRVSKIKWFRP